MHCESRILVYPLTGVVINSSSHLPTPAMFRVLQKGGVSIPSGAQLTFIGHRFLAARGEVAQERSGERAFVTSCFEHRGSFSAAKGTPLKQPSRRKLGPFLGPALPSSDVPGKSPGSPQIR